MAPPHYYPLLRFALYQLQTYQILYFPNRQIRALRNFLIRQFSHHKHTACSLFRPCLFAFFRPLLFSLLCYFLCSFISQFFKRLTHSLLTSFGLVSTKSPSSIPCISLKFICFYNMIPQNTSLFNDYSANSVISSIDSYFSRDKEK